MLRQLLSSPLRLIPLAAAVLLAVSAPAAPMTPSGFTIHRGTNLSHWLSQDFGWSPRHQFITENDLRFLARTGFDHVRLPIDEKDLWLEDGRVNEDAFVVMLQAIGWARANHLRVIVDLHTVRAHHFNAANEGLTNTLWSDPKAQAHFLSLWRDLSARLHDQPVDAVAYEIMNEPVADDPADWNKLAAAAIRQIRASEPQRVIVLGANKWQMPQNLPALEVPAGDKNIILSIHTYVPLLFTHYLAEWTPLKVYTGPVHYPGPVVDAQTQKQLLASGGQNIADLIGNARDDWGPARFRAELEPAIRRAKELGLPLYCGEFGCLPTVPRAERLAYYRDIVGVFEAAGMAWCNWEYKGDFGLLEWHGTAYQGGAPDVELIDAVLGRR
jgi:endoglucanase